MAQARNSEVAKLPPDLVKLALDAPRAVYMALRRPDGYGRGWGYSAWDVFDGSPDLGIKIGTLGQLERAQANIKPLWGYQRVGMTEIIRAAGGRRAALEGLMEALWRSGRWEPVRGRTSGDWPIAGKWKR